MLEEEKLVAKCSKLYYINNSHWLVRNNKTVGIKRIQKNNKKIKNATI